MIYKVILGKTEIRIGEKDKQKIMQNIDKSFIVLESGEIINPSFVQGIFIDHEAGKYETIESSKKKVVMINGKPTLMLE